ncbi:unnamed protein product [Hydatigera taeniaeformis]|uniref:S1-like domain-containing protein n=1 Tax=Hydatigena taeniaeformis TaxID=6205 RepID=A0A0R3WN86_HYDTA|nr:unnamed protein product [Hydatigera taeniaeformis]
MPKVKGEVVCLLSDDQVLDLAKSPDWPRIFTYLPEGRTGKSKSDEAYLDADALPPSDPEDSEDYEDKCGSSEESDEACKEIV